MSVQQLRDSAAFAAGAMHERRRIGELLRQRGRDLEQLGSMGLPLSTVRMLTSEVQLLINAIEQGI